MKLLATLTLFLILSACSSQPIQESKPIPTIPTSQSFEVQIDYPALQRSLGLEKNRDDLGLNEKPFNTCQAGYGYSSSQNCRQEFLTVLHFQLLCRDSEGTISNILSDSDLRPLDRRNVRWNLKGVQGTVRTDSDGFGQIVTSSRTPQRSQRIRLAIGNEFLYMRAGEIKKVITPRPWCDQQ